MSYTLRNFSVGCPTKTVRVTSEVTVERAAPVEDHCIAFLNDAVAGVMVRRCRIRPTGANAKAGPQTSLLHQCPSRSIALSVSPDKGPPSMNSPRPRRSGGNFRQRGDFLCILRYPQRLEHREPEIHDAGNLACSLSRNPLHS